MTDLQFKDVLKHEVKTACNENGIKVFMNHMTLLEYGTTNGMVDYVMFRDRKTGKEYQCCASWKNYTPEHHSKWLVTEYTD